MNQNLFKIITLLNDGEFHSSNHLSQQLQIKRAAVYQAIKKLKQYHIPIHAIKNKGYAFSEPLLLLDKKKIKERVNHHHIDISIFETISSTNDYLRSEPKSKHPILCLAEQQTKGKGRLNRTWYSPFGQNIYASFLYPFNKQIHALAGLSLVVSLATLKTLQQFLPHHSLQVKWPNDIVYQKQKVAGILIDVHTETDQSCDMIIGIGMNINMVKNNHPIQQPWTSLKKINQCYYDRNILCASLINHLFSYLDQFSAKGLTYFIDEWKSADSLFDKIITIKQGSKKFQGYAKGITHLGQLLLECEDGKIKAFTSGDASIIKNL